MKQFLYAYADTCALIGTFVLPLIFTVLTKQIAGKAVRALAAYFFFFGPVGTLVFISFHLFENSYRAIDAYFAGSFAYDFHFYSIILMGLVVFTIGLRLLAACRQYAAAGNSYRQYFRTIAVLLLVTTPLIPITPISAVPAIASAISMLAFPLLRRRQNQVQTIDVFNPSVMREEDSIAARVIEDEKVATL